MGTADKLWDMAAANFGKVARVKLKTYNLVAQFVPCLGCFNPLDKEHLHTFEDENNLALNSVMLASWLKVIDKWSKGQTVASLKITCCSPKAVNDFIHKNLKELL
ncbi:hypothetical protein C0993_004490 [Termitomyces sp. T159_Od127]|nr:hypothetical protein C0993_004490 [Termitomyces sp. T159_Od127]